MVDLYSLTAATTARKEAEARAAMRAYEKRKTRAAQVAVLLEDAVQAATNAAAAAPHPMASATPQRQTAETAPGDAGFRADQHGMCHGKATRVLGLHTCCLNGRLERAVTKNVIFELSNRT